MAAAASSFPGGYSPAREAVSNLGNPVLNPFPGWLFFSLAFWSLSPLMVPAFALYHRRLLPLAPSEARTGTLAACVGLSGTTLLGFFPNVDETLVQHGVAALLSFGGLGAAAASYWLATSRDALRHALRTRDHALLATLALVVVTFVAMTLAGLAQALNTDAFGGFAPWEWFTFVDVTFLLVVVGLLLPPDQAA